MSEEPARARGAGGDVAAVLVVLVLSGAVAVLALASAPGVVPLGGGDYRTEFVSGWWWLAFLLTPLPAACARRRIATAAAATAALVLPQFVAAAVCVSRYRDSGWADGMEVLAYLHPALLTLTTGVLCAIGAAATRRT